MDQLKRCIDLINEYEGRHLPASTSTRADIALIFSASQGNRSLLAISMLLCDHDFLSQAMMVVRSFYENSLRVLWATLAPSGWDSLQKKWASELRKFNRKTAEAKSESGARVGDVTRPQLGCDRTEPAEELPSAEVLIKHAYEHLVSDGIVGADAACTAAAYDHAYFYLFPTMYIHNQPAAMRPASYPEATSEAVTINAIAATSLLVQAICRQFHSDYIAGSHAVKRKIAAIMMEGRS